MTTRKTKSRLNALYVSVVLTTGLSFVLSAQQVKTDEVKKPENQPQQTTTSANEKNDTQASVQTAVPEKTVKQETPLDVKQNPEKDQKTTDTKLSTANKNKPDDKFIPTEEISEDLAVSFPIDI